MTLTDHYRDAALILRKDDTMKQIVCDYCEKVIKEPFTNYRGDLDNSTCAIIDITPRNLNKTSTHISKPDLCRECIIRVLQG